MRPFNSAISRMHIPTHLCTNPALHTFMIAHNPFIPDHNSPICHDNISPIPDTTPPPVPSNVFIFPTPVQRHTPYNGSRPQKPHQERGMETRQLGTDGLQVPIIGLGAFPFSGSMGDVTDERSMRVIQRALDLGMTFIDTAEGYGRGRSETVIGRVTKDLPRDQVMLATKVFGRPLTKERIQHALHSSLLRFGTDYVDLYQIHWPDPNTPVEESMRAMDDLVREGKVRHVGVSNFDVPLLKRAMAVRPVASNQVPYSLLDRAIEDEIMPFCRDNGIAIMPYSPLGKGLLTGKFDKDTKFPETDARARMSGFRAEKYESNLRVAEVVVELATEKGVRPSQIAIAWTLIRPEVAVCIPGATQPVQVDENAGAANITLTPEDLARLEAVSSKALGGTEVGF